MHCVVLFSAGIPSLIFSNGRDLLIGDIHGNSLRTLVHSQNRGVAVGVDFHYNLHRIFWTDTIQNKVFLTNYICYCYRTEVGLNLIVVIILRNICNPNTIIMRWLLAPAWLSHNEGRGRWGMEFKWPNLETCLIYWYDVHIPVSNFCNLIVSEVIRLYLFSAALYCISTGILWKPLCSAHVCLLCG